MMIMHGGLRKELAHFFPEMYPLQHLRRSREDEESAIAGIRVETE